MLSIFYFLRFGIAKKGEPVFNIFCEYFKIRFCSNNLYGCYFGDLKEILSLFKETHNVHTSFLKLLEEHIKIDELSENHMALLSKGL